MLSPRDHVDDSLDFFHQLEHWLDFSEAEVSTGQKKTIYLMFKSRVTPDGFEAVTRQLNIGCIKTNAAAKKVKM